MFRIYLNMQESLPLLSSWMLFPGHLIVFNGRKKRLHAGSCWWAGKGPGWVGVSFAIHQTFILVQPFFHAEINDVWPSCCFQREKAN